MNSKGRPKTQWPAVSRRELMLISAAEIGGHSLSGWLPALAAHAAEHSGPARKHKSCVLLWMDGGPSQTETFDTKPDASSSIQGDVESINTSVPGIHIGEHFGELSKWMQHAAILRSMSTSEADHGRARIYMHTGYKPGFGGVTYAGLGSTVAAEIGNPELPLPSFVVTGTPLNKYDVLRDPGYRGPNHQPLVLADVNQGLNHATPTIPTPEFERRVSVLEQLEQDFARTTGSHAARNHQAGISAALRLMRSSGREAFDLSRESNAVHERYGNSDFGRGCLLARRLVEAGVAFVEVYLSNWDSHDKRVAEESRVLMKHVDAGVAALVDDLHDRGRLDDTLILWMGEFGRTPRINRNSGRDHYARAWSTLLLGGGIRGGQVIGSTDGTGSEVTERPISAIDFMATICRLLGIDYQKEVLAPNGRPIRIVDKNEQLIRELVTT